MRIFHRPGEPSLSLAEPLGFIAADGAKPEVRSLTASLRRPDEGPELRWRTEPSSFWRRSRRKLRPASDRDGPGSAELRTLRPAAGRERRARFPLPGRVWRKKSRAGLEPNTVQKRVVGPALPPPGPCLAYDPPSVFASNTVRQEVVPSRVLHQIPSASGVQFWRPLPSARIAQLCGQTRLQTDDLGPFLLTPAGPYLPDRIFREF